MKNIKHNLSLLKKSLFTYKKTYSYGGCDILINYVLQKISNGFYIDIGCQNPISNNNTYLLHKRGWKGLNIDLDQKNIDLFNIARPKDINLCLAISSEIKEKNLYFYHEGSPINSLSPKLSNYKKDKPLIKKVSTELLENVLKNLNIKSFDYINIDVEGHELEVLKNFDIQLYKPKAVSVEYLDFTMNKLVFKNNKLENVIESELYKYFIKNDYFFVNWIHSDLIFVHKDFRD